MVITSHSDGVYSITRNAQHALAFILQDPQLPFFCPGFHPLRGMKISPPINWLVVLSKFYLSGNWGPSLHITSLVENTSECASQSLANVFKRFLIQKTKADLFLPMETYSYKELADSHIASDQFMSVADFSTKMLRALFAHTATLIHYRCEQKTSIPSKSCTRGSNVEVKSCLLSKMSARENPGASLELCVSFHL